MSGLHRHATCPTGIADLPTDGSAIAAAIDMAERFAAGAGCDGEWCMRLLILVEELVANLIDHGALPVDSSITLALARAEDAIRLDIVDRGRPFDPRTAPPDNDDLPPEEGGGAGLRLLAAWAVITGYDSADGANRLTIEIARPA
ncbi:anti-sigma regulatory factor (Ser/Thr protein kinase) [Sphingomonas zeicaulis]|uniref:ATP-binding protein n=1 Tax=Sphingomonas zeicaulis TaxID=1632740 RepID=UPI003D248391